jgi:hypothetical protein
MVSLSPKIDEHIVDDNAYNLFSFPARLPLLNYRFVEKLSCSFRNVFSQFDTAIIAGSLGCHKQVIGAVSQILYVGYGNSTSRT